MVSHIVLPSSLVLVADAYPQDPDLVRVTNINYKCGVTINVEFAGRRLEGLTSAIKIALGPSMAICDVEGKVIGIESSLPVKLSFQINSFQHGQTNTCTTEYRRPRYTVDSPDPLSLRTNITVKKETPFSESPELCTTVEIEEHYRGALA